MLKPRIIPCLLVHNKGLVKTVNFKDPKYVGDPLNAVKIFNEKEVDELMVLDIDASAENRGPDFTLIKNLAAECRMPLCYGGGVNSIDQAIQIINLGAEKVALSNAIVNNPQLINHIAKAVGTQSVVAVLDIKKTGFLKKYEIFTINGTKATGLKPVDFAKQVEELGAGEIVINSIDKDGLMTGYDIELISKIREAVNIPISVLGGAGSIEDISDLIKKFGVIGAAAGSIFVFKGKYKAVLINYPNRAEKAELLKKFY